MHRKHTSGRKCLTNYSQSFSNLPHNHFLALDLKEFWLRKSLFNPSQGLAESYAARNHIAGAQVPTIEVLHSSKRWLLLQSPRLSPTFFNKINSGQLGNPFQMILRVFKSFVNLAGIYGYFLITAKMIFFKRRQLCIWINQDIFADKPLIPLKRGLQGEKQFVVGFLLLLEKQIKQWERVTNIFTIDDAIKLIEWRNQIRRGSLTAVRASKEVFYRPNQSSTSFDINEIGYYNSGIKGCMSVQNIEPTASFDYFYEDISSSFTVKEQKGSFMTRQLGKNLLYDEQDMKISIYDELKPAETSQQVRKTKKKFNLTSTSSTLEKFSEKLASTVGRKALKMKNDHLGSIEKQISKESTSEFDKNKTLHRSEPISIVHELQGLFLEDEKHQFKLGVEGDRQQLQKISEEIEQVLTW